MIKLKEEVFIGNKPNVINVGDMDSPKWLEIPEKKIRAFMDKDSNILRDSLGHTACVKCGRAVSRKVEGYSMKNFNRVLCFRCQHERNENAL